MKINVCKLNTDSFTWHGNEGRADFKDLPMTCAHGEISVRSTKTNRVVKFIYKGIRYWMPMGNDGMYEIRGYNYVSECGEFKIYISDPHDMGKRL